MKRLALLITRQVNEPCANKEFRSANDHSFAQMYTYACFKNRDHKPLGLTTNVGDRCEYPTHSSSPCPKFEVFMFMSSFSSVTGRGRFWRVDRVDRTYIGALSCIRFTERSISILSLDTLSTRFHLSLSLFSLLMRLPVFRWACPILTTGHPHAWAVE